MSESNRGQEPLIDLDTVRETLEYIRDDVAAAPRLAAVGRAIDKVLEEIAAAEAGSAVKALANEVPSRVVAFRPARVRFVPWTPKA
ncbi:MAG: hypothetical protein JSS20_19955 [Proteobacteria bacterium]|nr:hypothetical protein [Pseudomonadota bacterium]